MQAVVTIPPSGAPTPPEGHDAAMLARYEAGQAAAAAGLSQVPPATPPVTPPVTPPATPPASPPAPQTPPQGGDFVDSLLGKAGLSRDALSQEFLQGGLSDASYAALAKQGVNKEAVDSYFNGVKAQLDTQRTEYEGGVLKAANLTTEKYAEVVGWAAKGLAAAEIEQFNAAVNSGDAARAAFAVAGLQARYAAANPAEPALLTQGTPAGGAAAYESWAQVKADMAKPEYKKDPAFRATVRSRLSVSGALQ